MTKNLRLTVRDYLDILNYYKIDATQLNKKEVQTKAEYLLASKLCKCIKKIKRRVDGKRESRAAAICYDSVIRKKGLKTFKFKCTDGPRLLAKKGTQKIKVVKLNKSKIKQV